MTALNASRIFPSSGGVSRTLLAAALIALSIGPVAVYGTAATSSTAEYLLELYEATRAKLLELVNASASVNVSAQEDGMGDSCGQLMINVNASISKGDELAEQARAALEAGNEQEAAVLAKRAINALTSAFVHTTICLGRTGSWSGGGNATNQSAGPHHPPPGLQAAITRHEIRLARLRAATEAAAASGMNVSAVLELLQEASELLEAARESALAGDVGNATKAMSMANHLMGKVASMLKTASAKAIENRLKKLCGDGNCTISVLNLTKITPGLQKALERRCKALGSSVNLTFVSPGAHKGKGLGHKGNNTGEPPSAQSKPKPGEKPGHGPDVTPGKEKEHPGRGKGHEKDKCPPGRCRG